MFESAELGHRLDKETYERQLPALREGLLDAQYDLLQAGSFSVVIVVGGVDGAGKGETVNALYEWLDPRHLLSTAFDDPTDEERERPPMWRYWRVLPPKGSIGIFFGSWYSEPILDLAVGRLKPARFDRQMQEILRFERMLAGEDVLILKFWLHLSRKEQKARLKSLENKPETRWRVTEIEWRHFKHYDELRAASGRALRQTSIAEAPWFVVEGSDLRYSRFAVGQEILRALRDRLDGEAPPVPTVETPPLPARVDERTVLNTLDLTQRLDEDLYDQELEAHQGRLNLLSRDARFRDISMVMVFEGSDAAGKGGSIRRITAALDARRYRVIPIAAPSEEERAQPYLWRFWRALPRRGHFAIFDRSWYGRVLVERVESLTPVPDWMRAYGEINDFERQLVDARTVLVKFWLQISPEEQLRRFQEREQTGFKRYKLTGDDWRNRDKWDPYQQAACDMIERTSTDIAPWTLVEAEDKNYARIKILKTVYERIEAALEQR